MIVEQKKETRKHYIDNLRNLAILLLFPVHTFLWRFVGEFYWLAFHFGSTCCRKKVFE